MIDTLPDPNLKAVAEVLRTLGHDTRLRLTATPACSGRDVGRRDRSSRRPSRLAVFDAGRSWSADVLTERDLVARN